MAEDPYVLDHALVARAVVHRGLFALSVAAVVPDVVPEAEARPHPPLVAQNLPWWSAGGEKQEKKGEEESREGAEEDSGEGRERREGREEGGGREGGKRNEIRAAIPSPSLEVYEFYEFYDRYWTAGRGLGPVHGPIGESMLRME